MKHTWEGFRKRCPIMEVRSPLVCSKTPDLGPRSPLSPSYELGVSSKLHSIGTMNAKRELSLCPDIVLTYTKTSSHILVGT